MAAMAYLKPKSCPSTNQGRSSGRIGATRTLPVGKRPVVAIREERLRSATGSAKDASTMKAIWISLLSLGLGGAVFGYLAEGWFARRCFGDSNRCVRYVD